MTVLCDIDNWVTWEEATRSLGEIHDLPASSTTFDSLEAKWQDLLTFAAEFLFVRTGSYYTGPCPWRYEPTYLARMNGALCSACQGWHHNGMDWAFYAGEYHAGSCPGRDAILLGPAPIRSVVSVTEEGSALVDGTDYKLVNRMYLVRLGDETWPAPPSDWDPSPVPLTVDYTAGEDVPTMLRQACRIMASELILSDAGDPKAKLPKYWQSMSRDGLTVTSRQITPEEVAQAFTGISPLLDQVLAVASSWDGKSTPHFDVGIAGTRTPDWAPRASA